MVEAYGTSYRSIVEELAGLQRRIAAAQAAGEPVGRSWLLRQRNLNAVLGSVRIALRDFAAMATGLTAGSQASAVEQAFRDSRVLVELSMGNPPTGASLSWSRLPEREIEHLVGITRSGPLADLFAGMATDGAVSARAALIRSMSLGYGPAKLAREFRDALGIPLSRAMTIARTEQMRAYRSAALAEYRENRHVVKSHMWHCELGTRSCAACIAMHGTILPLTESIDGHVRCRCVGVPVTATWAELGFADVPDVPRQVQTGPDWFAAQPPEAQAAILGPGKLTAYREGRLTLPDLVARSQHPTWGSMRYESSLREALAVRRAA